MLKIALFAPKSTTSLRKPTPIVSKIINPIPILVLRPEPIVHAAVLAGASTHILLPHHLRLRPEYWPLGRRRQSRGRFLARVRYGLFGEGGWAEDGEGDRILHHELILWYAVLLLAAVLAVYQGCANRMLHFLGWRMRRFGAEVGVLGGVLDLGWLPYWLRLQGRLCVGLAFFESNRFGLRPLDHLVLDLLFLFFYFY